MVKNDSWTIVRIIIATQGVPSQLLWLYATLSPNLVEVQAGVTTGSLPARARTVFTDMYV